MSRPDKGRVQPNEGCGIQWGWKSGMDGGSGWVSGGAPRPAHSCNNSENIISIDSQGPHAWQQQRVGQWGGLYLLESMAKRNWPHIQQIQDVCHRIREVSPHLRVEHTSCGQHAEAALGHLASPD